MNINNFCILGNDKIFNSGLLIFNAKEFIKLVDYTELYKYIIIKCIQAINISKEKYNINNYIIIVNLQDTSKKNIDLKFFKQVVVKLQKELPDVLNKCIFYNSSIIFKSIYSIISFFISEKTKKKIIFSNQKFIENITL